LLTIRRYGAHARHWLSALAFRQQDHHFVTRAVTGIPDAGVCIRQISAKQRPLTKARHIFEELRVLARQQVLWIKQGSGNIGSPESLTFRLPVNLAGSTVRLQIERSQRASLFVGDQRPANILFAKCSDIFVAGVFVRVQYVIPGLIGTGFVVCAAFEFDVLGVDRTRTNFREIADALGNARDHALRFGYVNDRAAVSRMLLENSRIGPVHKNNRQKAPARDFTAYLKLLCLRTDSRLKLMVADS